MDDNRNLENKTTPTGLFERDEIENYEDFYPDFEDDEEESPVESKSFKDFAQEEFTEPEEKSSDFYLEPRVLDLSDQEEEARKKKFYRLMVIAGGILLVLLAVYIFGIVYYRNIFFPDTYINGVNVSGKNAGEALLALQQATDEHSVELIGMNNEKATVTGSEIGLTFDDAPDVRKLLEGQNTFVWPFALLIPRETDLNSEYSVNTDSFNQVINRLPMVSGANIIAPQDASINFNGTEFQIVPEVQGNQVNINRLKEAIELALVSGEKKLDLEEAGVYNLPKVAKENSKLKSDLEKLNDTLKAVITLTFPTQEVVLDKGTYGYWLYISNNKVTVNDTNLTNYVAGLASQFNTRGKTFYFKASNGQTYTFNSAQGYELNQPDEVAELKKQILQGEVITENPIWIQTGGVNVNGDTISGTYVEISLDEQQIWCYKDNQVLAMTDIVSGDVASDERTPEGLFYIQAKDSGFEMDVRLPNGTTEEVTAGYWLPFNGTVGIAGADWRNNFGGTLYHFQGTNGNVDVPEPFAQILFNTLNVGDPVVIY